jgi:hypothetical protein
MDDLTPEEVKILDKANTTKVNPADIEAMRQVLDNHPDICKQVGDMIQQNIHMMTTIENGWPPLAAEGTKRAIKNKRKELGFEAAPMLEKMVIDAVLLAWLRWQNVEYKYTTMNQGEGMTITRAAFWEKRLSAAQGRYLRACETLARIRKLALPLQVNIATQGGQQVNIAGDLVTNKSNG